MSTGFAKWRKRWADHALRFGISTVLLVGLDRGNPSAVVNAAVSLATSFVPSVLERRYGLDLQPWQRLWITGAMLLHAIGMLGPYDRTWWWDHVTHTLSASIVGGVAYVVARTRTGSDPSTRKRHSVFVVGVTLGFGVFWEVIEYLIHHFASRAGVEPILVSYGRNDTALDLVFDLVGAGLVVLLGPDALANVVNSLTEGSVSTSSEEIEPGSNGHDVVSE